MIRLGDVSVDVFCIGSPNISGDAIGPLVGSMLQQHSFESDVRIIGTLDNPVISNNYNDKLKLLRPGATVIAVDCVLSKKQFGTFTVMYGSIAPGSSMEKGLQPVGDIAVKCYTATSLNDVYRANHWDVSLMAYKVTTELIDLLSFNKNKDIYSNKNILSKKTQFQLLS